MIEINPEVEREYFIKTAKGGLAAAYAAEGLYLAEFLSEQQDSETLSRLWKEYFLSISFLARHLILSKEFPGALTYNRRLNELLVEDDIDEQQYLFQHLLEMRRCMELEMHIAGVI